MSRRLGTPSGREAARRQALNSVRLGGLSPFRRMMEVTFILQGEASETFVSMLGL